MGSVVDRLRGILHLMKGGTGSEGASRLLESMDLGVEVPLNQVVGEIGFGFRRR